MKTINFRFLHYKKYDKFKQDLLNLNKIKEGDIVFIQDKLRIWARGKEYFGDDSYVQDIADIKEILKNLKNNVDQNDLNLATVAHTGLYSDLIGAPDPIIIDSQLSSTSLNPVQNKAIYDKLESKADVSDLSNYVTNSTYTAGINTKQDKLTAGYGINISDKNVISSTVDTEVYVIVSDLQSVEEPNPNKIYLLETPDGHGSVTYQQYRYKNGQWVLFGQMQANIDLSQYLKSSVAEQLYQPKRNDYVITSDLLNYTPLSRTQAIEESLNNYVQYTYLRENYQPKGDYAYKTWVEDTFVKKKDVYSPEQYNELAEGGSGEEGSSGVIIQPSAANITIDSALSLTSANPVENRVITTALQGKVDNSTLRDYAQKSDLNSKADASLLSNYVQTSAFTSALESKQDVLQAGDGISIVNNTISSTVDTNLMVITDDLQNINSPSPNKIYLLEIVEDGDTIYIEYRWKNNDWVEIGQRTPEIDLGNYYTKQEANDLHSSITSSYLSKAEASQTYQTKIDDYATSEDIEELDEKFDDYATKQALEALKTYSDIKFASKGNYVLAEDVATALQVLQTIIDQKYVLKRDVYRPNDADGWSTAEATEIAIQGASGGSSTGGTTVINNMVTLSASSYQRLVDANMVDETTYYFTYEDEEETTNWTFGDTFPVTLSGDGVGTFPITLT